MKKTPLTRKARLKATSSLERTKPVKRVNAKRREKLFIRHFGSDERVQWIRSRPCIRCGSLPSVNAHIRSRGAGGGPEEIVSMCHDCHTDLHSWGRETFERLTGLDLAEKARHTKEDWQIFLSTDRAVKDRAKHEPPAPEAVSSAL